MKKTSYFYNTVGLTNPRLQKQIEKAKSQEDKIYAIFKAYPKKHFTSRDIEKIVKILLTSVHRCLSNLTNNGYIVRTNEKVEGIYGVTNGTWKLK